MYPFTKRTFSLLTNQSNHSFLLTITEAPSAPMAINLERQRDPNLSSMRLDIALEIPPASALLTCVNPTKYVKTYEDIFHIIQVYYLHDVPNSSQMFWRRQMSDSLDPSDIMEKNENEALSTFFPAMLYVHQPYMKPTADNIYLLYKYSPFADLLPDLTIRVMFICYINIPNFQAFCLIYRTKCYIVCVWSTRFCNAMRISKQQWKFVNSSLVHHNKCFWGSWLCKWFLWGLFPCKITCVYFWRLVFFHYITLKILGTCHKFPGVAFWYFKLLVHSLHVMTSLSGLYTNHGNVDFHVDWNERHLFSDSYFCWPSFFCSLVLLFQYGGGWTPYQYRSILVEKSISS